jgi:hypothetical protein
MVNVNVNPGITVFFATLVIQMNITVTGSANLALPIPNNPFLLTGPPKLIAAAAAVSRQLPICSRRIGGMKARSYRMLAAIKLMGFIVHLNFNAPPGQLHGRWPWMVNLCIHIRPMVLALVPLDTLSLVATANPIFVKKQKTLMTTDPMATFIACMGPSVAKRALALALAMVDTFWTVRMQIQRVLLALRRTPWHAPSAVAQTLQNVMKEPVRCLGLILKIVKVALIAVPCHQCCMWRILGIRMYGHFKGVESTCIMFAMMAENWY